MKLGQQRERAEMRAQRGGDNGGRGRCEHTRGEGEPFK
jgi:hypothetical protein